MRQKDVARALGLSKAQIQIIERSAFEKIAKALDLEISPRPRWLQEVLSPRTSYRKRKR
jgi:transcriptional regulator with XRE-family HTH domain